mgnify:FL=1
MLKSRSILALSLAVAVVGVFPAIAAAQDETSELEGPVWDLIVPDDSAADVPASMALEDGTASVFAGCNSYFGDYSLDGGSLSFGVLAGTLAACEPNVEEIEATFLAGLEATASYQIDGGVLTLLDESGSQVLNFDEAGVATTDDLTTLGFEIAKTQAHIQQLRGHVRNIDVRGDVEALEAHVNELSKQHINQRTKQQELRKRVHALETQVSSLSQSLGAQGIIPTGDTE